MKFEFKPSFNRSIKSLPFEEKEEINPPTFPRSIGLRGKDLKTPFIPAARPRGFREGGGIKKIAIRILDILTKDRETRKGMGLTHLRGDFWEVRKGLKARILFRWQEDLVEFVLAGDHNQIKRYLKNT